jgi:hypothetical protein
MTGVWSYNPGPLNQDPGGGSQMPKKKRIIDAFPISTELPVSDGVSETLSPNKKQDDTDDEPVVNIRTTVLDEVAQSRWYYRGYCMPELKAALPREPKVWIVDRYYPIAKGGPLYVEEVATHKGEESRYQTNQTDAADAERKQKILKGMGKRVLIVNPDMTKEEILSQLNRIDSELGTPKGPPNAA